MSLQQLDMQENHIFQYGFMGGYDVWIYDGENPNATINSNVPEQNKGIPNMNEMFDMLDDIINDDVQVDSAFIETSNV